MPAQLPQQSQDNSPQLEIFSTSRKTPGKYNYITANRFFAGFISVITIFNYANSTLAIKSKKVKTIEWRKPWELKIHDHHSVFGWGSFYFHWLLSLLFGLLNFLVIPQFPMHWWGRRISNNLITDPMNLFDLLVFGNSGGHIASYPRDLLGAWGAQSSLFQEDLRVLAFQQFPIRKYWWNQSFVNFWNCH